MESNKPKEANPADPGKVAASEEGPSRRELLVKGGKVAAGIGVAALLGNLGNWALSYAADKEPIKIGILHSLSGTMAISEVSLRDTVMMAVEEINVKGGVMGRMIKPVVVDPASNWDLFAEKAKQLLLQDKVSVTFGCWTSVSRKSVLPVFEKNNGLLFYPVQYEGEECSRNVFYTGAAPNQQAVPAVDYLMSKEGGGFKKFYLLGTDYVYPRTTNKILRAMLLAKKVPAANIEEEYTPFHHQDYQTICGKLKKFAAGGGAAVISTINGDSNVPFYKEFANQGLRAEDAPIMAFSVAEDELRGMDTSALVGHLAAWNYYQSVDTPQNKKFVADFKAYCKKNNLPDGDKRVTDDPIEAAYFGVYIWKQAVEKAASTEVDKVRKAVYPALFMTVRCKIAQSRCETGTRSRETPRRTSTVRRGSERRACPPKARRSSESAIEAEVLMNNAGYGSKFMAPGGEIMMDAANHHTYRPVLIGEILKDGQFKVVSRSPGLVKPEPWSEFTNPEKGCDWVAHQGTYQK